MEKLIHDLLDFSRVDARGADFFTQDELRRGPRRRHPQSAIVDRGERRRDHAGALPVVTGDPVQLTRLFQNLLVNSIKYRVRGGSPHSHRRQPA